MFNAAALMFNSVALEFNSATPMLNSTGNDYYSYLCQAPAIIHIIHIIVPFVYFLP